MTGEQARSRLTGLSAPTRKDMALMYADAIQSERNGVVEVDWPAINRAIIDRWSLSGLKWIKARAWKILEAKDA